MSNIVIQQNKPGAGCAIQVLWWLFIGWWAGAIWAILAWVLGVSIIGLPIAVKMFNRLPQVIALRQPEEKLNVTVVEGVTVIGSSNKSQYNIFLRLLYLIFIGWWLSAIWIVIAYVLCYTVIGMPLGFWMFDKVPMIVSLYQS